MRVIVLMGTLSFALLAAQFVAPSHAAAEEGEEFHRNSVELFFGGATRFEDGETPSGFAFGVGYERRFVRWFGAGLIVEVATNDLRDAILLFPANWHPWRGLRLTVAPGVEFSKEETSWGGSTRGPPTSSRSGATSPSRRSSTSTSRTVRRRWCTGSASAGGSRRSRPRSIPAVRACDLPPASRWR